MSDIRQKMHTTFVSALNDMGKKAYAAGYRNGLRNGCLIGLTAGFIGGYLICC